MHLSLVIDWSSIDGVKSFMIGRDGSSEDASGNSAILSIRGVLTETSGDFNLVRMSAPRLFSGVLNMCGESDARRVACPVWSSVYLDGGGCLFQNNTRLKPCIHNILSSKQNASHMHLTSEWQQKFLKHGLAKAAKSNMGTRCWIFCSGQ